MLEIFDKFTVNVFRQATRYFKWVTNTKVDSNYVVFTLEKPEEELRITRDAEGNYTFLYTTDNKVKSEILTEDTLTLKNIRLHLGYLFYI